MEVPSFKVATIDVRAYGRHPARDEIQIAVQPLAGIEMCKTKILQGR